MKDLPKYYVVGLRPVKVIRNEEGEVGSFAYNWETGGFDLAFRYFDEIYFGKGDDVEQVSEDKFNECVEKLRLQLKGKKKSLESNS